MEQPTGNAEIVGTLEGAVAAARGVIGAVRPERWQDPSPCAGWSARDVVNHLVAAHEMAASAFACACAYPQGDRLGGDPAGAYAAASDRLLAAVRQPGALAKTLEMPYGAVPAETIVAYQFVDALVHAWDVAKATGQSTDIAPALSEAALAFSREAMADLDRAASGMFGLEQPAPAGATAADRLAAFLGRRV